MSVVSMRELLEAGVHFGHQTRRWNPKMRRYIFTERGGIYIIDLQQTLDLVEQAHSFVRNVAERGGSVLFVGTKKQSQDSIAEEAERVGMPYVNHRWLGGLLTNWRTISERLDRMQELRRLRDEGQLELLPAKERMTMTAELEKLETNLGGVDDMKRLPDAIFVVDLKKEQLAIREARRLNLPVVALVDTNCDPDDADYVIPGNDDAIRSCSLIIRAIANGIEAGKQKVTPRRDDRADERPARGEGSGAGCRGSACRTGGRGSSNRGGRRRAGGGGGAGRMTEISASQVKELRDMTGAPMMDAKRALVETEGDLEKAAQLLREKGLSAAAKRAGRQVTEGRVIARIENTHGAIVAVGSETEPVSKNDEFLGFAEKVIDAVEKEGPDAISELETERVDLVARIGENIEVVGASRFEAHDNEVLASYVHPPAQKIGVLVRAQGSSDLARLVAMHIAFANPRFVTRDEVPDDEIAAERDILEKLPDLEGKPDDVKAKMIEGRLAKGFFADSVLTDQPWIHNPDQTVGQALAEHGAEVRDFVRYALAG